MVRIDRAQRVGRIVNEVAVGVAEAVVDVSNSVRAKDRILTIVSTITTNNSKLFTAYCQCLRLLFSFTFNALHINICHSQKGAYLR